MKLVQVLFLSLLVLSFQALSCSSQDQKISSSATPGCRLSLEGTLKKGESFEYPLGEGLVFTLENENSMSDEPWAKSSWEIGMFHSSQKEKDLVFPVTPPYGTSEHLMIGSEYAMSPRESVDRAPLIFHFLIQKKDIQVAWAAVERVHRPKNKDDFYEGLKIIKDLPVGEGKLEVLSVTYETAHNVRKHKDEEIIGQFRFRVCLNWPKGKLKDFPGVLP